MPSVMVSQGFFSLFPSASCCVYITPRTTCTPEPTPQIYHLDLITSASSPHHDAEHGLPSRTFFATKMTKYALHDINSHNMLCCKDSGQGRAGQGRAGQGRAGQGNARHLVVQAGPRRVNQEDLYTGATLLQECRNACNGASSAGPAHKPIQALPALLPQLLPSLKVRSEVG